MDDPSVAAIGAVCGVLALMVLMIAVYSIRRQRRHGDRMRQWAERNGWTLTRKPNVHWGSRLPGGNRNGVSHAFTSVLHGREVHVAEYSVTDASDGTTTNTHHYVITVVRLKGSIPPTGVELRSRTSRLKAEVFGAGEAATGDADFDRAYRIRTTEPAKLHQWLTPALIAAHLAGRLPVPWSVQGPDLICHRPGQLHANEVPGCAAAALYLACLLDGSRMA